MQTTCGGPGKKGTVDASDEADRLDELEAGLGYRFKERGRLEHALRHSSYAHEMSQTRERSGRSGQEDPPVEDNERLEFLGDAILALVVADLLYQAKPDWPEGDLTRGLHALVEGRSLEKLARSIGVGPAIRLGRTERQSGGDEKASILENAMEAILGAIYLDGGLGPVRDFVERVFADALAADAVPVRRDPKTELQERAMARSGEFPAYRLLEDSLIEGDEGRFTIEVELQGQALGRGVGRTKRAGERQAAAEALAQWISQEKAGD